MHAPGHSERSRAWPRGAPEAATEGREEGLVMVRSPGNRLKRHSTRGAGPLVVPKIGEARRKGEGQVGGSPGLQEAERAKSGARGNLARRAASRTPATRQGQGPSAGFRCVSAAPAAYPALHRYAGGTDRDAPLEPRDDLADTCAAPKAAERSGEVPSHHLRQVTPL